MANAQSGTPIVDPATVDAILKAIQAGNTSTQVSQPLGVPYYVIDPATGQPYKDASGQQVRWGAPVTSTTTEDDLRYRGGRPGTHQIAGTSTQYVAPRYFDGAQWLPAQLPPDQLASLQRRMVTAGLLKSGEAQLGVWDTASVTAYTKLLEYANASGLDNAAALDRWEAAHAADPNAGRAPLQVKVTNPDELAQVFRAAVINTRGEGWASDKIQQMVNAYQGIESGAQQQAYNMQDTGGTVVAPPSAQSFAETQVRQQDPLGAQEHDIIKPGGPLDSFKQMIASW